MIAGVVAVAAVSIASIAGILSLAWALVKRADECAQLREQLAIARSNVLQSDRDLDRMEEAYASEAEKTSALVASIADKHEDERPRDPFVLFDRVLGDWKKRAGKTANGIREDRKLRAAVSAPAVKANAGDGPKGAADVSRDGTAKPPDIVVPDTDPGVPGALAKKGRRP